MHRVDSRYARPRSRHLKVGPFSGDLVRGMLVLTTTGGRRMATKNFLAIDIGAESGRAVLGKFDGKRVELEEIHRFPNGAIRKLDTLQWDAPRLYQETIEGLTQ